MLIKPLPILDLISRPSEEPGTACGSCHAEVSEVYPDSLHASQAGYWTTIDARNTPEDHLPWKKCLVIIVQAAIHPVAIAMSANQPLSAVA